MPRRLTHDETLRWVREHRAWRLARKTKPVWARAVADDEVGKNFTTADHVDQVARAGYWVSVGSSGEPWFQTADAIDAKYQQRREEQHQFVFDNQPRTYFEFVPRAEARNWAACVEGPDIEGFYIQPSYDRGNPLYSPAGGYVVRDPADDPYADEPSDVWLVQRSLFESTYDWA